MNHFKKIKIIFLFAFILVLFQSEVYADQRPGSPLYDTFENLLKDFEYDVKEISIKVPKSILLNIFLENGISTSFKEHVRRSFETLKVKDSNFHFKYCPACTVKRGDTIGKQVYFRKSFKNLKSIQSITKKKKVNSYGEVTIIKNILSLELKVSFYSAKDGTLIWTKTYKNKMIKVGDTNLTSSIFFRFGWEWGSPLLISFSLGEKVYGVGEVDLNFTIGTPTEALDSNGNLASNQNVSAVNSYIAFGPQFTLNINEFFKFRSSWGNHIAYGEIGFCRYARYKLDSEQIDPEGVWGHNLSFGYGVNIKDMIILSFGFVKGFFFSSDDENQKYPWVLNTGFGFRF